MSDARASLREARERAQWWLDNEGDTGTVSGRSMLMARDVVSLVSVAEAARDVLHNGLLNDCQHVYPRGECIACSFKAALASVV